jgi:predicted molibdopterin-dependent oxidoreductase YjgC
VFGAGGGTNSYAEVEEADVVFLWGSNAREAHPIWFHHLLRGLHRGTRLYVMDPRRTASAQWADVWLGLEIGTDIALANAMAREILRAGLEHREFIGRATSGFEEYRRSIEPCTLPWAEKVTGIPAEVIAEAAHAFARAGKAMICWTLGITEHHDAVDNVHALINLALLTGHVGRRGSGLNPLRGQNNVQGGGDMGAIPNRLPGFQDIRDPEVRQRFEDAWGVSLRADYGWTLTQMLRAMHRGELTSLLCIGENPASSDADAGHVRALLAGLDHLVVQEVALTQTARLAHVVLPAAVSFCEGEGTVTSSERRVQRVRKAVEPPGEARDELWILCELAKRLGRDLGPPRAESVWDELRRLAPAFAGGMSYARLEAHGGLQWPCPDEAHPGTQVLHTRLWSEHVGRPAPFFPVQQVGPLERPDESYPLLLTTGRRLDSYNTGVATGALASPLRRGETLDLSPEDAARLGVQAGETVRISTRRGSVLAPARIDPALRQGTVFMTFHFPDEVATNLLTHDAVDPKSGTAEFKACAARVERAEVR